MNRSFQFCCRMLPRGFRIAIATLGLLAITAASANATVISVVGTTGHNNRDNFGGNMADLTGGESSGMDFNGFPNDPSQWEAISNAFGNEWQSGDLLDAVEDNGGNPISNGKIGWVSFNLGSAVANLDKLYLWNVRENANRAVNAYNVYYAMTPTVALPAAPTGLASVDYNFASGGWTQIGGTNNMSFRTTDGAAANDVVDLGGITAQYIAVEILSNGVGVAGDTTRTGLAEVAITAVPEPSSLALLACGALGLCFIRRKS